MITFDQILCPTDFSEPSRAATSYALELARRLGAGIRLLTVIETPLPYPPVLGAHPPDTKAQEDFAETALNNWIEPKDAEGVTIEAEWVHGSTAEKILEVAEERESDLIVMGTHGRGFIPRLLLGSVAERVVRLSKCPVLTVRPDDSTEE